MAGVAYSDDRVDQIGYPDSEMLNETFYIYKDTDNSSMQCGDIASYSGKKIGTLKGDQRMTAALEQWKARHRADIEIEYYSDLVECARAFNEQQIDGFVSADNVVSSYSGITPKRSASSFFICALQRKGRICSVN